MVADYDLVLFDPDTDEEYSFLCNQEECDPNFSTKMYCGEDLLSDNYFAYGALMNALESISKGEIIKYKMSSTMTRNYEFMLQRGDFND